MRLRIAITTGQLRSRAEVWNLLKITVHLATGINVTAGTVVDSREFRGGQVATGGSEFGDPHGKRRAELRSILDTRLERIRAGSGSVIDPEIAEIASDLAALLRDGDGDIESRLSLGWFHWLRVFALPPERGEDDLYRSIELLAPVFMSDVDLDRLPAALLPALAIHVGDVAWTLLDEALDVGNSEADIDTVVFLWQRIVEVTPADDPERPGCLGNLGLALQNRFERQGSVDDLHKAVGLYRDAVDCCVPDYPERSACLDMLGRALIRRHERFGGVTDLNEAVEVARQAVDGTAAGEPAHATYLNTLAIALHSRFERIGGLDDLTEAVDIARRAVRNAPPGHPDHLVNRNTLGLILNSRFGQFDAMADLDEAIELARSTALAIESGSPDRALILNNLATLLITRFDRIGAPSDLEEAVVVAGRAVHSAVAGSQSHAMCSSTLGLALRTRFGRLGAVADLDEAVEVSRQAVHGYSPDHPSYLKCLNNFGNTLRARFERIGAIADLAEAIRVTRLVVAATPIDHPDHAMHLDTLGVNLRLMFERTDVVADLDEAVEVNRQAVRGTLPGSPGYAKRLGALGNTLGQRFSRVGSTADLNEAVGALRRAVAATPKNHVDRAMVSHNLGFILVQRYLHANVAEDLSEAIELSNQAVQLIPVDHRDRARFASLHGFALQTRFERSTDPEDLAQASAAWAHAATVPGAAPSVRIGAAAACAGLIGEAEPGRAAALLEQAIRLLPDVAPRQLARSDQQHALVLSSELAADAAALALNDPSVPAQDRPTKALWLLETGRAILLNRALQGRSDLTVLAEQHPGLAAEFQRLRLLLDETPYDTTLSMEQEAAVPDRHRLARDFDEVLNRIRSEPGFEFFARPQSIEQLQAQAGEGPIVALNISRFRSDALLVTPGAVISVPLADLTRDTVIDNVEAFHQALDALNTPVWSARRAAERQLCAVLEWLWDVAAEPVLQALGDHGAFPSDQAEPRVWWIPAGLMSLLPIHAAGYHTEPPDLAARAVIDRVVSSYTPTIGALRHARRPAPTNSTIAPALIVAMPTTPGHPHRLPGVLDETRMLTALLPATIALVETDGADGDSLPTKAAVTKLLQTCSLVHLACHGISDPVDPSNSRLLLHDHDTDPLTVTALASLHLDHAQMAYLSACETAAATNPHLLDEVIHLTSTFQLAGYRHVIGTLWPINDDIAVQVARTFYTTLHTGSGNGSLEIERAAHALHQAIRAAREKFPTSPSRWAAHLHAGA
ncbi:CHAT domain-containing protein [Nocardia sp. NPDC059240]|uniref:CHAT domain-containing protein n=1 Tax=Nocardia sp. NPDC059240 TaxID=3346786 RepID=UPI00368B193E